MRPAFLPLFLVVALALPASAAADTALPSGSSGGDSLSPHATLRKAEAAFAPRRTARPARELTPLLKQLAVALPSLKTRERRRAARLLARPTQGEEASNENAYSVPEHRPLLCSEHFCIHWVDSTVDAPPGAAPGVTPDYVNMIDRIFERVYAVENDALGWQRPKPDGSRGCPADAGTDCMNKTDVYLKDIGDQGIYGYSAPDPRQKTFSQTAYLVIDNNYNEPVFTSRYPEGPARPAEVTAAHEYNHVLQFGYDVVQDTWMFEATAVWMEDKVFSDVNDYLQYIAPWAQLSSVPLTTFNSNRSDDPLNVKVYGDMVWNRWLDGRFGPGIVREAWEHSLTSKPKPSFAPGSYDQALAAHHSSFYAAFSSFAADTAEWRASNSAFAEGDTFPDVERARTSIGPVHLAADHPGVSGRLSHTAFDLIDVTPSTARRFKLVLNAPSGRRMAIALVGRAGDPTTGTAVVRLKRLPNGGTGAVSIDAPSSFSRLTAAVINADGRTTGRYSNTIQDWDWKSDNVRFSARISTDYRRPRLSRRAPAPNALGVPRGARIRVRFSETVRGASSSSVTLTAPNGRRVKARVRLTGGRNLELVPTAALRARTRYTVRFSSAVADLGGNALASSSRAWSFVTAR
jgi:hypothetical protein